MNKIVETNKNVKEFLKRASNVEFNYEDRKIYYQIIIVKMKDGIDDFIDKLEKELKED